MRHLGTIGLALLLSTGAAWAESPASHPDAAAPSAVPAVAPPSVSPAAPSDLPDAPPSEAHAKADESHAPAPKQARVIRVIDGDTLVLEGDERVRVLYINTPEKKEEWGPEAGAFTREMLLYKKVDLIYSAASERDHYGRLLAEVYLDGQSLEEALLREGLAHLFLIAPETPPANLAHLVAVQNEARDAKRNMWGSERFASTLHITSFHANARGHDGENLNGEYLRIANVSGAPLNVAGYTLSSAHGKVLTLPDFTIPAGYSFQILSGEGVTNDDIAAGALQIYWGSKWPIWNNEGDAGVLRDAGGRPVDHVEHYPKSH